MRTFILAAKFVFICWRILGNEESVNICIILSLNDTIMFYKYIMLNKYNCISYLLEINIKNRPRNQIGVSYLIYVPIYKTSNILWKCYVHIKWNSCHYFTLQISFVEDASLPCLRVEHCNRRKTREKIQ